MADSDDSIQSSSDNDNYDYEDDNKHVRKFKEQEYWRKIDERAKTEKYLRDLEGLEDEEEEEQEPKDKYADEGEEFWLTVDMLFGMYDNFPKNEMIRGLSSYVNKDGGRWCYLCGNFSVEGRCEHYGVDAKLNKICKGFPYSSCYGSHFGKSEANTIAWNLRKMRTLHDTPIISKLTDKMRENIEKEKLGIEKAGSAAKIERNMALYKAIRFFEMMPSSDIDVEMRKINNFKAVSAAIKRVGKDTENEKKILEVIANVNKEISKAKRTKGTLKRKATTTTPAASGSKKKA